MWIFTEYWFVFIVVNTGVIAFNQSAKLYLVTARTAYDLCWAKC